jgi:CBS domain containing-hemolysin-like protein
MLIEMSDDEPDPRHSAPFKNSPQPSSPESGTRNNNPVSWLKSLIRGKASNSNNLREALEDYIEELEENSDGASIDTHHELVANVLQTHEKSADDVMIPRADIVAIEVNAPFEELRPILMDKQYSRIPVYEETLDNVIGTIHIKDILAKILAGEDIVLSELAREVEIVSPSMPVIDLLQMMRKDRRHMVLVMDEFGGIDGLVTINDIMEVIVGDIDDEFDAEEDEPRIIEKKDGSLIADGRFDIDDFEDRYGHILTSEEREEIDTLGGLAMSLADRIPERGDILRHSSGMTVEVLHVDKARVHRLRLRDLPHHYNGDEV